MSEDRKISSCFLHVKKPLCSFLLCLSLLTSVFALSSCSEETVSKTAQFFVFDTVVDVTAYGDNAQRAVEAVRDELYRYESMLSASGVGSEIYRVNSNELQQVSKETAEIIEGSLAISELTEGCLDITVYPLVELWGFADGNYRVPEASEIQEALNFVGYEKVSVSGGQVIKDDPQVKIDLGAVAKGYIGDKAAQAIKNAGCDSAIVSIGGNVVTIGTKPGGEAFNVGVSWIDGKGICAAVELRDISAVTSGTYQRNFTENGVFYHHIIDPKTGYPAESDIGSVTIFSVNGLAADGLSTAFFVMGSEKAKSFYESKKYLELGVESLDFMIIKNDGTCIVTEGVYKNMKIDTDYITEDKLTVI